MLVAPALVWSQQPADSMATAAESLARGDLQTAETEIRQALEKNPSNPRAWLALSAFQAARGEIVDALKSARRADALAPDQPITLLTIARLQATLEAWSAALQTLDRVLRIDDQNSDAWILSAYLLRDTGQVTEAIEALQRAVDRGVADPRLVEELGLLLLDQDRSAEALELAQSLLENEPDRWRSHLIAGLAMARDPDRRTTAILHLEKALAEGASANIRFELAGLLVDAGRVEEALEHLAEVEKARPDDPDVLYRKGLALQKAGDAEGAKAALDRFQAVKQLELTAEADAKRLGTRFNEARVLANDNKLAEAVAVLDEILAERPTHARSLSLRGKVLFSMGRTQEALESMANARRVEPGVLEHSYLEGLFLLNLGRAADAETALLRAVAIDGGLAEAYELLGQASARQNQYDRSAIYFERALSLGRDTAELRLNYANVLESLGRTEDFQEQMDAYRRLRDETP